MLILALLACPAPDDTDPVDVAAEHAAPGPYGVGYRESALTYPDTAGGADRTLRLAWWYPTEDTSGAETRYDGVFEAPGVWLDASVAAGPFPLAVFTHGHQGYAENSSFLMRHLASHGWVGVAPDHTGNTTFDGSERSTEIYFQRPLDVSAVLDAAPAAGLPIDGPTVLIGHSFGGYTAHALAGATYDEAALAACATAESAFCSTMSAEYEAIFRGGLADDRIAAAISMAPGDYALFGPEGLGAVDIPVLHMSGTLDAGDNDLIWAALARDGNRRLQLAGGGHQTFTDFSGILETMDGLIAADEGFRIIDAYALAWARQAAGDDSGAALLDGTVEVSAAADLILP